MEELGTYLQEILTSEELVCLPGFGGFISKHVSSGFDPSKNIFTPPHKQIAFNERLCDESESLLTLIQKRKNLQRTDALKEIEKYVDQVKDSLNSNSEYTITGLGLLYTNNKGTIGFKADISPSLDPLNFGLPQILIKYSPLERSTNFLQKPKDRKAMSTLDLQSVPDPGSPGDNPSKAKNAKSEKQGNPLIWLYIITPIILLGGMAMFLGGTDDGRKVLANMNILPSPAAPADSVFSDSVSSADMSLEETPASSESPTSTESFDNAASAEETISKTDNQTWGEEPVKSKQEEIAKTDEPVLAIANIINGKSGRCFVIVGGFENKKNAFKLREKLVQDGLEAKIIAPTSTSNLYRVSLGDYAEKATALQKADELKSSYGDNLWVMIY